MATNVPVTVWRPTNFNGEAGQSNDENITTISDLELVTLAGVELIVAAGTVTPLPVTVWVENDGD